MERSTTDAQETAAPRSARGIAAWTDVAKRLIRRVLYANEKRGRSPFRQYRR